jgi:hypothetical protein
MAKKRAGASDPAADEVLEALYAAAPRTFVGERKRAMAALKAAGRTDEARAIAKLKRPSASVWAVNQLARRAPDELAELIDLGAMLRDEERKLMRGGSAEGFMTDARTARQKVAALARRAESFVTEAGQKATVTVGRKIAQTLHAASIADDETRAQLQAGRLREDLVPPSSFGAGGDLATTLAASLGAASKTPSKHASAERKHAAAERKSAAAPHAIERAPSAAERKRAAAERKRAAAAQRSQRRAQAAARKHAATLERAAAAAARVVAERARAVEKARTAVERAESELRAAKDALVDAETAASAARRAADEAAAAAR